MMKKGLVVLFVLLASFSKSNAQDAVFSQFYASQLYLNPSLAATEPAMLFSTNYRNQWRSIVIPYVTTQASFIYPLITKELRRERHWGGIGLSFYNDKAGAGNFKTTGFNATFAYNIPLNSEQTKNISLGVQGGFIQKNIDYTNLQWGQQYSPYLGFDASVPVDESQLGDQAFYPDINAGFTFYSNRKPDNVLGMSGYFGVAAYHINQPNESFVDGVESRLPILYKAHGGLKIPLSAKFSVSPNVLALYQHDVYHLNGGLYLAYQIIGATEGFFRETDAILGSWYRYGDSFIFSVGFGNDIYTLGFSYDYNTSNLRYATNGRGAYEISLTLRKGSVKRVWKRIETPRI